MRPHKGRILVSGWALSFKARSGLVVLGIALIMVIVVCTWPYFGLRVSAFYPRPARGISGAEMFGVLLAGLTPSLALNRWIIFERFTRGRRAVVLTVQSTLYLFVPVIPFVCWYARVQITNASDTPAPLPFMGSLLVYSCVGTLSVRLLGQLLGPSLLIGFFSAIVILQNHEGPYVLGSVFSTGYEWQTRWSVVILILAVTVFINYRYRGTQSRRLISRNSG